MLPLSGEGEEGDLGEEEWKAGRRTIRGGEGTDGPRKATPKADPSRQNLRRDPNGNTKVTITRQTPEQLHQRLTPSRQNLRRDPNGNTKEREGIREGKRGGGGMERARDLLRRFQMCAGDTRTREQRSRGGSPRACTYQSTNGNREGIQPGARDAWTLVGRGLLPTSPQVAKRQIPSPVQRGPASASRAGPR